MGVIGHDQVSLDQIRWLGLGEIKIKWLGHVGSTHFEPKLGLTKPKIELTVVLIIIIISRINYIFDP